MSLTINVVIIVTEYTVKNVGQLLSEKWICHQSVKRNDRCVFANKPERFTTGTSKYYIIKIQI